ncbi:MAG: amidohydrolase family protein [Bdellovibrionales bacterium]|nr:amidohydrolase family protein [Oligoflexia bacterium]
MQFDLGVRAKHLLPMKDGTGDVHADYFIGVKAGIITEVGPYRASHLKETAQFIDGSDHLVIPGLINGHTHLAMSLFRGFEDDVPFHDWLFKTIFPLEAKLVDEKFVRLGTELSALECIRFGTTTVNDMYFFSGVTAQVLDHAGMRAIVAWPFIDFPTPDEKHLGDTALSSRPERFLEFFEKYKGHPRIRAALGPHAPYTCSDELIRMVTQLSHQHQVPVHMHVCETCREVDESVQVYGKTPVQRLYDLGALHNRFYAAHGVHLSDAEVALFVETGASIIYNPDSNMKLSSGIAPIAKYRKAGIPIALGTDGAASNNDLSLFGAMDLGTKLQKLSGQHNTAMVALDALNLATYEGARALGLSSLVGSLEIGKRADFVVLRTDLPHVKPLYSVLSQLVYAYQGLEVDTVVCDGKVLLNRGKFTTLDEVSIYAQVEEMRKNVSQSLEINEDN